MAASRRDRNHSSDRHLNTVAALMSSVVLAACGGNASSPMPPAPPAPKTPSRVLLISVDGLHEQDVAHCLAAATCPNIAALVATGVHYTNATTPGLSDSFPWLAALLTGGSPKTTGLFYDVSYDRTLYAPSDTTCSGTAGWNVVFDETTGIDGLNGGPLVHLDGGGAFNPPAIPHAKVNGNCVPVYPHDYIKTNTLFEVVKANLAGARTAWTDKHAWGYDWLNGRSGQGVDDLGRTEINFDRRDDRHGLHGHLHPYPEVRRPAPGDRPEPGRRQDGVRRRSRPRANRLRHQFPDAQRRPEGAAREER